MDMTMLLALIFSIHINYLQPPSFYLKVPTLLYIFIFIALRALHYQVRRHSCRLRRDVRLVVDDLVRRSSRPTGHNDHTRLCGVHDIQ
jgi:hypothetical protein